MSNPDTTKEHELLQAAKNVLAQIDDLDRMAMPGAFERLEEAVIAIEAVTHAK